MYAPAAAGASAYPRDTDDLTRSELRRRVLVLRAAGASYRRIGAAVGISHTYAHRLVTDAVEAPRGGLAERIRARELADVDGRLRSLRRRRRVLAAATVAVSASVGGAA